MGSVDAEALGEAEELGDVDVEGLGVVLAEPLGLVLADGEVVSSVQVRNGMHVSVLEVLEGDGEPLVLEDGLVLDVGELLPVAVSLGLAASQSLACCLA